MILSNTKDKHRYRPGFGGLATTLAAAASSAILLLAAFVVVVVHARDGTDEAFPVVTVTNTIAGIVEPYPDDFDIAIGEGESLLFAGTWDAPSRLWTDFFVESDVPVILNRITAGPSSRLSWGVPRGVSVIVKTDCSSSNNNNNNNDTVSEGEAEFDSIEIDPIISTEMLSVYGQNVPKISIMARADDDEEEEEEEEDGIPPPPEPSIPLAESRMAGDEDTGESSFGNLLPSSEYTHDYECLRGFGSPCVPKTNNDNNDNNNNNDNKNEGSPLASQAAASPGADLSKTFDDSANSPSPTDDGAAQAAAAKASTTDPPANRPSPTDGPAGSSPVATATSSATTNDASASSAGSAGMTTTNLLLGVVTTVSLLVFGTVGFAFDKNQRNTMMGATAIAVFATVCIAIPPPQAHSLPSPGEQSGGSRSLGDAQPQCSINVEIVYWGCDHQVYIDAPGVSLRDGVETSESDWDTCECREQQNFANATATTTTTTTTTTTESGRGNPDRITELEITNYLGESSTVYHVPGYDLGSSCFLAIGRPFRDTAGNIVSAGICDPTGDETSVNDETEQSWSEPSLSFLSDAGGGPGIGDPNGPDQRRLGGNNRKERERLGKEWTDRALGEHASIASFAAFTLALLSNRAPPGLVRDSLTAAQDELRHAGVSFEIASVLSGRTVEPTALPPSELQFGADRNELALGTAREGCVEETLSAIEMAVEYDEFVASGSGGGAGDGSDDFAALLQPIMETTKTIALEEGNHSVLAWRTIQWICSSSDNNDNSNEACEAVHQQVLDPFLLADAGEKRFPTSPRARQIWECIWTSVLPAIAGFGNAGTGNGNGTEETTDGYEKCALGGIRGIAGDDNGAGTLSELLVSKIVSQVRQGDDIGFGAETIAETK